MKKQSGVVLTRACATVGLLLLALASALSVTLRPEGLLTRLLRWTHRTIDAPKVFGAYHLCMLALCLVLVLVVVLLRGRIRKVSLDSIMFAAGVFFFLMELYKQLYHHAVLGNGTYNFGILPLQLCSYCLYLCLIIPWLPEGKLKQTLYLFTAFYQTMGGVLVMAYPLFYGQLSLSIHTMLWHIVMVALGVTVMLSRGYGKRYWREILPPIAVFSAVFGLSIAINLLLTPYAQNSPSPLNLFYMSPYEKCTYFVIKDVREAWGWIPSLICYFLLFIGVGANLCWVTARILHWLTAREEKKET